MEFHELLLLFVLHAWEHCLKQQRSQRRFWVHPIYQLHSDRGQFSLLYHDLREHPEKFRNYTRMTIATFDYLLYLLRPALLRDDTNCREAITPCERLLITLRYLATGNTYSSLQYEFRLGISTISKIVQDTCDAIWKLRRSFMPTPNKEKWEDIAKAFWNKTNFPNCLGAIDGKHIRLIKPCHSGSQYYNYKKYFSVVLMAVVDADYKFIFVDIGSFGSNADSAVFQRSTFGKRLVSNELDLPDNRPLPGTEGPKMPYVFVADDAFAIHEHLMKPFSQRNLDNRKRIFNYRLCRARRLVECAFGILANKWQIFLKPINLKIENACKVIKAACILHNLVRERDGVNFEDTLSHNIEPAEFLHVRGPMVGFTIRDAFADYFMSSAGALSWQENMI
ncbi:protein ANTAGONIST OF LIKE HETEROCHROMATIN PROTEIN 1-like [Rana temporaria]|uniref:protein ANTAGONIST OF LIKE HETEROCHROMATIN PROTEIN 1-like n=2 Tax=Rana temporaria TaxID=8407 RepID=UPI001AAC7D40|nr:protein ANTAGONIST OF LIKE HETEROCHROMATIN PROTEIN 1-like [Rana temporaria]